MNKTITKLIIGGAVILAAVPQAAQATNWFALQGNEAPGTAAPVKIWGFMQPAFEYYTGDGVSGAANANFNGRDPVFNKVAPDQTSTSSFFLRRARVGVRGVMSPIDERINYFIMAEFGKNGITREDAVALADASVTLNYIPGARIRIGQFKLPMAEEGLQSVPIVYAYNNFTSVLDSLVLERFMVANGAPGQAGNLYAAPPAGTVGGNVVGSSSAFRDIGMQAYDWFTKGKMEYAYAAMVSNGSGINTTDNNGDRDITARLQASYIFGGAGVFREDLTGWIWRQQGNRTFDGNSYRRVREGLGFKYWQKPLRVSGEYMRGKGMIFTGLNPPFNDTGFDATPTVDGVQSPTNTMALGTENKADGWYLEAGYFVMPKLELDLRYDTFDRLSNNAAQERQFTTWTLGTQYHFSPKARVTLNYEFRDQEVPNPGAITQAAQRQNALAISDAIGDRFSAQVNFIF